MNSVCARLLKLVSLRAFTKVCKKEKLMEFWQLHRLLSSSFSF